MKAKKQYVNVSVTVQSVWIFNEASTVQFVAKQLGAIF